MRIHRVWSVLIALSLLLIAPVCTQAGTVEKGTKTIVAYVAAEFDDEANLVGITLEEDEGALYSVVLDQKGLELGHDFDGEWVEVTGGVAEKEGEIWITVKSVSRVPQAEEDDQWLEEEEVWDDDPADLPDDSGDEEPAGEEGSWEEDAEPAPPEGDEEPAEGPDRF